WILSIYCRYCNFFIEDLGMREKYLDKIEYYAKLEEPVSRWWIDAISFTFNHGTPEDIKEMIQKALHLASVDFSELHMFLGYDLEDIVPKKMFKELRAEIDKTYDRVVGNRNKKWSTYFPTSFLCQKPFINMGKSESLPAFDREIFKENPVFRFNQSRHIFDREIFKENPVLRFNQSRHSKSEFAPTPFKTPKFVPQYFSITKPIMWYIMKNASFIVRIKLYKSCKYFYYEKRLVPVYSIKVEGTLPPPPQHHFPPGFPVPDPPPPKAKSKELSLSCSIRHQSFQYLNDLWINGIFVSLFNDSTQLIMPKVKKFEPVIIHLQSQTVPLTTFQKLMEGNNCKVLKLEETFFTHADGTTRANLNEILQASSTVVDYTFRCQNLAVNNQELSRLVLKNKIQRLTFKFANDLLEIPTFLQFLKKNAAPLCKIVICFDETANVQYRIQMKEALKLFNNEMPTFCGKEWIMYKFKDHSF
uniref:DUF38 domain-containing protein n=1 Tax=Panagrolaimus sp. PS1159 TaxID=55785 RepID=A0AC35GH79_9BILA